MGSICEDEADKIFNCCYKNDYQNVTKVKLYQVLRGWFGTCYSQHDVACMFHGLDNPLYKYRSITREEFKNQICPKINRRQAFLDAFNKLDINGTGFLTHDELRGLCRQHGLSDSEIDGLIKADCDGDAKIGKKEFMRLL